MGASPPWHASQWLRRKLSALSTEYSSTESATIEVAHNSPIANVWTIAARWRARLPLSCMVKLGPPFHCAGRAPLIADNRLC